MEDILSLILILDEDQYDRLGRQIDNWSSVYYMVEEYKYQIKNLDYYVVELAVESYYYEAKDVIRFLANSIEYYAMRVAGSKDIFIRNYGDLIDLKEDCYKTESAVRITHIPTNTVAFCLALQHGTDFLFSLGKKFSLASDPVQNRF